VPTIGETSAPGFAQTTWMGFLAPKGTPEDIRLRVHTAVVAALKDSTVVDRLHELGFEPSGLDGSAFGKLFDDTVRTFADIGTERQIVAGD
jgi:tripartite-type tricarboxylate transporter receptor subunit TctC